MKRKWYFWKFRSDLTTGGNTVVKVTDSPALAKPKQRSIKLLNGVEVKLAGASLFDANDVEFGFVLLDGDQSGLEFTVGEPIIDGPKDENGRIA